MSQFTDGDSAINRLNAATAAFEKVLTEPEGTMVEMPIGPAQPSLAERLKRATDAVTVKPAQAAAQAIAAAQQTQLDRQAAAQSAADAANSAAATGYVAPPFPDVWAPLNDDLRLLAGFAPADTITVGGTSYPLPSKSLTFSRASTATYLDKSGALKTAAINEPRFEREGLLIEGQSTNLVVNSVDLMASTVPSLLGDGTYPVRTAGFTGPDGSLNALRVQLSRVTPTIANRSMLTTAASQFMPATPTTRAMTLRLSVWLKSNTASDQQVTIRVSGYSKQIIVTPAWQRFDVGGDLPVGTTDNSSYVVALHNDSNGATADVLIFGLQIEERPFATSYIPTTGVSSTRAEDVCGIQAGANILSNNVTISMSYDLLTPNNVTPGSDRRLIEFGASSGTVNRQMIHLSDTTKLMTAIWGNTSEPLAIGAPLSTADVITVVRTSALLKALASGTLYSTLQTVAAPALAPNVMLGSSVVSGSRLYGHIRNIRIWHRALSDTQIRGLR